MNLFHPHNICRLMCPALFLLSACSASEAPGEESGTFVPVQISSVALPSEAATRAITPLTSGSIGVFSTATTNGYSKVDNAKYSYASGAWTSTTPITVAGYPAQLCAYHPYGAASFTPGSTTFDLTAQLYTFKQDFSYATATEADNTVPAVSFAMKRGYAMLSLYITRQSGYSGGDCKISNVSLENPSGTLQSVRTLDISNGSYTDKTAQPTLSFTNLGALQSSGITSGETENLHLLLPPQSLTAGVHLLLTIDGVVQSLAIAQAQLSGWVVGKNYMVTIKVNDTGVSVGSVSTKEWGNKDINGGTTPGTPYVDYVILPDINLKVAKGNLMREGANGRWKLAPDQGYYTGIATGGDYFAWGIDDPTRFGNDVYGTNMDGLTAGCVAVLGAGWRVPTLADNGKLAGGANVWGTYTTPRGTVDGRYFGIGSQPDAAHQDDYAFLPAAGNRPGDVNIDYAGSIGYYWSSETSSRDFASTLGFDDSDVYESTSQFCGYGQPVRCVADYKEPYMPYVVVPSIGLKVAKGNLMREGANGAWKLTPDQGYYSGIANGGDYFCYGDANPTVVDNGALINADALTAGCVAVLGAGWRIPTKAEIGKFAEIADKVWGVYVSMRGTVTGYYFGTSSQPDIVHQDNYAFLPAAGYRGVNNVAVSGAGTAGYYWSSEYYYGVSSYRLLFSNGSVAGGNDYAVGNRANSQSLRCVSSN